MPSRRAPSRRIVLAGGLALFLAVVIATLLLMPGREADNPNVARPAAGTADIGGAFDLTDQAGQRRTDAEFRGRYMLVYFGYTFCPDICPTTLATMTEALDRLGEKAAAVQPIFITVDPARDTVAVLRDYAPHFHERLVALTGTAEQIAAAAKAYRVYVSVPAEAGEDYLVDHSGFLYLMDREGRYAAHFRHAVTPEELAAAIARIIG